MTWGSTRLSVKRGFAFMAGVGFAAIPTLGPFLAILAFFTGQPVIQRADLWWWLSGVLIGLPYLLNGHPADAGLAFAQVVAVWLIYRSATEFRKNLTNDVISRDIGAGLVLGLGITLVFGLLQIGQFRFDVARSPLDAIVWKTHPALFGHAILVLAALLAVVVPYARLRALALALGAIGVVVSGAREAVWAWLIITVGLLLLRRRGTRLTKIIEVALVVFMVLIVSGIGQSFGLGRTGYLTDFAPAPTEENLLRGTEVAAGDWWFPLGITYTSETLTIGGVSRTGLVVTKSWAEPWSRLQQAVPLTPDETYTLSAVVRAGEGTRPGFDGWGREAASTEAATLAATIDGAVLRTTASGDLVVVSSSIVTLDDEWQRIFVTFRYQGADSLMWYVGVVPDRSSALGGTTTFAEFQLTSSYTLLPYRPGQAERGVTDLRTSRVPIWRDALAAIQMRPLMGWGPNGLPTAVETLHPDETLLRPIAAHAHNTILAMWVDRGLVGVIGVLLLFAMLALRVVQQRDRAMAVVLVGVAVLNFFDTTFLSAAVIYPIAAVLGWRAVGHRQVASHETGAGSALLTRLGLAISDYGVALASLAISYIVFRNFAPQAVNQISLELVLYLACAWPLVNGALGQYPGYGRPDWQELQRTVVGSFAAGVLVVLVSSVFDTFGDIPTPYLIVATVFITLLSPFNRAITKLALRRLRVWGRPVVVVGNNGSADQLVKMLTSQPQLGLYPIALIDESRPADSEEFRGVQRSTQLTNTISDSSNHVIVAPGPGTSTVAHDILNAAGREAFRVVQFVPDLHSVPSSDVVARQLGRALSLEVRNNLAFSHNRFLKRTFDVVAVAIGSVFAAPLIGVIALAIRLDSPGKPFYRQTRIGRDGRTFSIWKFRSMVNNSAEVLAEILATDPQARREWEATQKLVNDPRVTRVGKILRKTSLDELPQLWNVVRGEMSLIGPRPVIEEEIEKYEDRYRYYTQVRPGMTGAWQVSGRSDTSYEQRVELDTYYVRNWNIWIDIDILIKTVGVVLKREGAY